MYSKTLTKAYDMLINYISPNKVTGGDAQNLGMSFYQQGEPSLAGRGRGRTGQGGGGHEAGRGRGRGSAGRATHAQGHSEEDEDDARTQLRGRRRRTRNRGQRNNTTKNSAHSYSTVSTTSSRTDHPNNHSSFNVCTAENILVLQHAKLVPDRWLLLDSCSTTDIVANRELLQDVKVADRPIWVRCNAGRVKLTRQGYLRDYPCSAWYNPTRTGVANILSLNNVSNHYRRVTMDTDLNKAMMVHRRDGTTIIFSPSDKARPL